MFPLNRRHFLGLGAAGLRMPQSVLASEGSIAFIDLCVGAGSHICSPTADNPFVYTPSPSWPPMRPSPT